MSSSKDRTDIAALHGLSGASEGNNSTWKREPTIIAVPGSAPMKRQPIHTNPFSTISSGYANVGDVKRSGGIGKPGGQSRSRKMDAMRPKHAEGGGYKLVSNRAKASTLVPTVQGDKFREAKRPRLSGGASNQHMIDLTGDDLDARTLLNAAAGPSHGPQPMSKKHRELNLAQDGPYTRQLDQKMNLDEDDDPIEMFSPSPETKEGGQKASTSTAKPQQRSGNVQQRIHFFEGKDRLSEPSFNPKPPPPRSKQDFKNHAKPQSLSATHAGTLGTPLTSKETKHSGKKRKRNPEEPFMLPLRKCIVKRADKASILDNSSCMTFEKNSLKVIECERTTILDVDTRDYNKRLLTQCADETQEAVFLWLDKPDIGKHAPVEWIALLLDCKHNDWDLETYKELKLWYRPNAEPPFSTGQDLWRLLETEARQSHGRQKETSGLGCANPQKPENQSSRMKPASVKGTDKTSGVARPTPTPIPVPRRDPRRPLLGNVYPGTDKPTQGPAQASTSKAVPNTATSPSTSKTELVAPLRRSGRQTTAATPRNPTDDEVILVFPPDAPGKVTITNADAGRLKPGEFLNDTLIEFGLKLWLKELEERSPEIAKQVHVFSSFFYKKLNKKNYEEGFKSVRKWTSKLDLFDKKYIIVPINENMHWYLAVIYEPEHVLRPPPPEPTPPLPSLTKESEEAAIGDESVVIVSASKSGSETAPSASTSDGEDQDPSAQKIEVMNVDSPKTPGAQTPSESRPPSPMQLSPEVPVFASGREAKSAEASTTTSSTAGDEADVLNLVDVPASEMVMDDDAHIPEIPPELFYGSTSTRSGKQYEKPQKAPARTRKSEPKARETYQRDHTYVLTMDSLGSKHAFAAKQLSRYLIAEAKDKKGVESTAKIQMKSVNVPTQPNYCDCGLYLLHLAETFISDAQNLIRRDFETTPRTTNSERQDLWRDFKVPMMRERLLSRIESLSHDWNKTQPQKSSSKDQEDTTTTKAKDDGSDSDADIIEIGPVTKAKKTPNKQAAARLR